jgi:RHS repeat-associated protein
LTQAIVPNVGTTTFRYDPFGRRIQKSGPLGTTNFLYDGMDISANVIEEMDSSGNVLARYTQSPAIDQPLAELRSGATSYYQQDALSSVTSLSNGTGALAETYSFDSFGTLTASTGTLTNPFQYTGREFDSETGLFYNRYRFYDPIVGRFLSEDPSGFGGGKNFYRYVKNSPTGSVDPLGLARCSYSVSGGMLICFPQEPGHDAVIIPVASGNNGDGMQCKNNPSCDPLHNRGPIPRGNWQWTTDPTSKPNGRVLVPMPGTMTWGRDLIRSHSCKNAFGPSVSSPFCSEGCVTGNPDDIRRLNQLIDSEPGSTVSVTD